MLQLKGRLGRGREHLLQGRIYPYLKRGADVSLSLLLLLAAAPLFLFAALRYGFGNDYFSYLARADPFSSGTGRTATGAVSAVQIPHHVHLRAA